MASLDRAKAVAPPRLRSDAERNRRRLLEATRKAVAEEGPDVAIEAIAKRAGVGVGTVYRRFANKQALLDAVAEDRIAQITQACDTALAEPDAWKGFCQLASFLVETQVRDRGFVHAVGEQLVGPNGRIAAKGQTALTSVEQVIARAQHAGALRADATLGDILWILSGLTAPPNPVLAQIVADPAAQITRSLAIMLDGLRE